MPIVSRVAAMTSKAWGQFKSGVSSLAGGYLYAWGNINDFYGNYYVSTSTSQSSPVQIGNGYWGGNSVMSFNNYVGHQVRNDGTLWTWGALNPLQFGTGVTVGGYGSPVQVGTLTNWATVSDGQDTAGAVKTDGTLWTWGFNTAGQLGDGTTVNQSSPIQVGTLTNWAKISVGYSFCAAIKSDGTLWTWGLNNSGQLGDGTAVNKSSPVQVGTLTNWSEVFAASSFAVALKTDNTLWAWGLNTSNQLGDGTSVTKSSPVQVGSSSDWTKLAPMLRGGLAINSSGKLYSWGSNTTLAEAGGGFGGVPNISSQYSSPVQMALAPWTRPSSRGNDGSQSGSMFIRFDGTLWSWGLNTNGEVGDGTTVNASFPVQIGTLTTWASCSNSDRNGGAIKNDGTLWLWGNGSYGQLGQNNTTSTSSPVQVGTLTNWSKLALGRFWSAAIKTDGTLWTWGENTSGQLGLGDTTNRSSPVQVGTLTTWSDLVAGQTFLIAITSSGSMWACGENTNGQLGLGNTVNRSSLVQVGTLTNWSKVSGGTNFTHAIKTDGSLWAWGAGTSGRLGTSNTTSYSSPVQIGTLTNWLKTSGGFEGAIAVKTDGTVWSWGGNTYGQLGQGNTTSRSSPTQIGTLTNASDVFATQYTLGYLDATGQAYTSGGLSTFLVGASAPRVSYPVQVGSLTTWSKIYCNGVYSDSSSVGIKADGSLWVWGQNNNGQLGLSSTANTFFSPVQLGTKTNWNSAVPAYRVVYFINSAGVLYASGYNLSSNFGNEMSTRSTPVIAGGYNQKFAKVSRGASFAVAVDTTKKLWSWGLNAAGQLGNGTTVDASGPIQIGTQTNWKDVVAYGGATTVGNSFAVNESGVLYGWGSTVAQGVGSGNPAARGIPIQMDQKIITAGTTAAYSDSYAALDSSRNSLLISGGGLYAIGNSGVGLGLNSTSGSQNTLTQVGTLTNWSKVAMGVSTSAAIKTDGTLWAWGVNGVGQVGSSNLTTYSSPVQIGTLTNWAEISCGNSFSMAVKTDGTLWGWGLNAQYQLGDGTSTNRSSPVQIGTQTNWAKVTSGLSHSMAIKTDGTLWGWGGNTAGQLGTGGTGTATSPVQIGTLTNWSKIKIALHSRSSMAVKTDGTLWSWGNGTGGVLAQGSATAYSSPVQVGTLTNWTDSYIGPYNSYMLNSSGQLYAVGTNSDGTYNTYGVGNNSSSTTDVSSPVQIGTYQDWSEILGVAWGGLVKSQDGLAFTWGGSNAYATGITGAGLSSPVQIGTLTNWSKPYIKSDGTLWLWDSTTANSASLGIGYAGSVAYATGPVRVGTNTWSEVSRGANFTLAIRTDGTLWGWGANTNGRLGTSNTTTYSSPVQVGTLSNWSKVYAGGNNYSLAVKTDGTLWAWGRNTEGQLGTGNITTVSSPVQIGTLTNWTSVGGASNTSYATRSDGTLWAWGVGANGRLGTGSTVAVSSPTQVDSSKNWISVPNTNANVITSELGGGIASN